MKHILTAVLAVVLVHSMAADSFAQEASVVPLGPGSTPGTILVEVSAGLNTAAECFDDWEIACGRNSTCVVSISPCPPNMTCNYNPTTAGVLLDVSDEYVVTPEQVELLAGTSYTIGGFAQLALYDVTIRGECSYTYCSSYHEYPEFVYETPVAIEAHSWSALKASDQER